MNHPCYTCKCSEAECRECGVNGMTKTVAFLPVKKTPGVKVNVKTWDVWTVRGRTAFLWERGIDKERLQWEKMLLKELGLPCFVEPSLERRNKASMERAATPNGDTAWDNPKYPGVIRTAERRGAMTQAEHGR